MEGVELAVGYLFAWAVSKARRVAGRADAEVDQVLDAGMDRLHDVVATRLGHEPALESVTREVTDGREEPTPETRGRLELALNDTVSRDAEFAEALRQAVEQVRAAEKPAAPDSPGKYTVSGITFNGSAGVQIGDGNTQTNHFNS
ncbi:hypothetical protein ACFRAR_07855 [Kitasatospora sp. NPDC056651]|uniref:hypothetical protein n=1 Tax=Kitasatospora sp. NPDC056651 TaxID=3345892 RepID=UPI0036A06805